MQSSCAVLHCHVLPVWLYHIFLPYLTNGVIFEKSIKSLFWFYLQSVPETFLNPRIIQPDIAISVHMSSSKVPLFLSDCNQTTDFSTDFRKILKYQISLKSNHWETSCSMRTDRRTNMTSLIVALRNFAIASNKRPSCTRSKSQHTRRAKEFNELCIIFFPFFLTRSQVPFGPADKNIYTCNWEMPTNSTKYITGWSWCTPATVGSNTLNILPSIIYK
jgi:hypothetical protein